MKRKYLLSEDGTTSEASFHTARTHGQSTTASLRRSDYRSSAPTKAPIRFQTKGKKASAAGPSNTTTTLDLDSYAMVKRGLELPKPSYAQLEEKNRELNKLVDKLQEQLTDSARELEVLKERVPVVVEAGNPTGEEGRQQSAVPDMVDDFPIEPLEDLMEDENVAIPAGDAVEDLVGMVGDMLLGGDDVAVPAGPRRVEVTPVEATYAVSVLLARLRDSERERARLEQENLVVGYWPGARDRILNRMRTQAARISALVCQL